MRGETGRHWQTAAQIRSKMAAGEMENSKESKLKNGIFLISPMQLTRNLAYRNFDSSNVKVDKAGKLIPRLT
jgi:hypothetical protein